MKVGHLGEWGKEKEAVPVADWRAQRWGGASRLPLPTNRRGPALCQFLREDAPAGRDETLAPALAGRRGNMAKKKSMRLFTSQRVSYIKMTDLYIK